jgi:uncharacterized membrane protein YkvA (DUF1232 family)
MNLDLEEKKRKRTPKDTVVLIIIILCSLYLINPTLGVFELIPDNIPFIGNLDEGVATTLLLSGLSYFGYNFTDLFKRNN